MIPHQDLMSYKVPSAPLSGTLRIAHTADTHIRLTLSGSRERGIDARTAFEDVLRKAKSRGADAVVVAGDLLDKAELNATVAADMAEILQLAEKLQLLVLTVQGNHDMSSPSWMEVLGSSFQMVQPIDNKIFKLSAPGKPDLKIHGLPFLPAQKMKSTLSELRAAPGADVLVWHGPVAEFADFQGDNVNLADFENLGTAAVLLGDIHKTAYAWVQGSGCVGYSGATELCKRDEPLTHTFTLFDFSYQDNWKLTGMELVPVDSRPTKVLRIDSQEQLATARAEVQSWASASHRPVQLFVKYCSEVDDVRRILTEIAGAGAIVRAESYDRITMEACASFVAEGKMPELPKYFAAAIPDEWGAELAAQLLAMPQGSDYAPTIQVAVSKLIKQ